MIPAAAAKNRIVHWGDRRLPIFTFLQHELDEYAMRTTRPYAPWRLITAIGNLAHCSAPIFQTSLGKDGFI